MEDSEELTKVNGNPASLVFHNRQHIISKRERQRTLAVVISDPSSVFSDP